jgi:hypothetical protein
MFHKIKTTLLEPVSIAPLVVFRWIFGLVMAYGSFRFLWNDWVPLFYQKPTFFFTYYGFDFIKPLSIEYMYVIYVLMGVSFLMLALGAWYRVFAVLSFILFTYTELIDKTNYLNHYYFISLVSFLMMFVPAHRYASVDVWRNPLIKRTHIPFIYIAVIQFQLGVVYFFAGVAKINYDWLFEAMPLKNWLMTRNDIPYVGEWIQYTWVAYFFSWFGMLYDLTIPFFLLNKKARPYAYIAVIAFHVFTRILFQIGMFPFIMIGATLIFFSSEFHQSILFFFLRKKEAWTNAVELTIKPLNSKLLLIGLTVYVAIQLLLPMRYLLYPGKLFWTEEGFRFSWRVMLIEKVGICFFYVKNPENGRMTEVIVSQYLTPMQEKMMSTQPDMILQFAHHLDEVYQKIGVKDPQVFVRSYVSLNGMPQKLFVDPMVDLSSCKESFAHKTWVVDYK